MGVRCECNFGDQYGIIWDLERNMRNLWGIFNDFYGIVPSKLEQ